MSDEVWLVIFGLLVVVIFMWQKWAQRKSAQQTHDDAGGFKIPPIPAPTHDHGVLIGETSPVVPPIAKVNSQEKPQSQPPRTTLPIKPQSGIKPPLVGQDRVEWQAKQWDEKERKRKQEEAARKRAAKARQAEKEKREKVEKARSMAAAEARMAEERTKKRVAVSRAADDKERAQQRQDYLKTKIPAHIQRDMDRFLAGEFDGPEQSPLTYVGYHVGVVRGLKQRDRVDRLEVCFRVHIPRELYAEYKGWGEPATTQRLNAMIAHIDRHTAMRSTQSKYEQAVSEWQMDRDWLMRELGPKAETLTERWLK